MTFHHNLYANNRTRNPFACSYRDHPNHCDCLGQAEGMGTSWQDHAWIWRSMSPLS